MKKIWQKVQTYRFDETERSVRAGIVGKVQTERSSYGTNVKNCKLCEEVIV